MRAKSCSNRWRNIVPALSWLLPVPFYFMEILVGFVQALVFMLLTAVFTMLIASINRLGDGPLKISAAVTVVSAEAAEQNQKQKAI